MPKNIGKITLYSIDDLHEKLGVSKLTLRSYLRSGKIRGKKLGVSWYVTEEALLEYFNSPDKAQEKPGPSALRAPSLHYIVQGINDLVSETEECNSADDVIALLEEQAILSLFQVKIMEKNTGRLIEIVKARDFIEQHKPH
jgi:hypothetical protein